MKCLASESPDALAATATTTEVQAEPTALEQLDREQASGFRGQRIGSRVVQGVGQEARKSSGPATALAPRSSRQASENAPQQSRFSHTYGLFASC